MVWKKGRDNLGTKKLLVDIHNFMEKKKGKEILVSSQEDGKNDRRENKVAWGKPNGLYWIGPIQNWGPDMINKEVWMIITQS